MSHENMITNNLAVEIRTVADAPVYDESYKIVRAVKAIVVPNGTVTNKPTVDLQIVDADGNKYVAMITGSLAVMLGKIVAANGGE